MGNEERTSMVLQLPKLLDDGCVLQAGATIHIWGAGDPGRGVLVRLDGKDRTTRVGGRRLMERAVRSDQSRRTVRFDGAL